MKFTVRDSMMTSDSTMKNGVKEIRHRKLCGYYDHETALLLDCWAASLRSLVELSLLALLLP